MKEIFNHINNQFVINNHLLKWINVTPTNIKINEVEYLRELKGNIKSITSKRIFGKNENNGPWQQILLNDNAQIIQISQLKSDGSKFIKEYDSYEMTKKQVWKDINSEGTLISIEERMFDGFENLVSRKLKNFINKNELNNVSDISIQELSKETTLVSLNNKSSKIKYYRLNNSIHKKVIYTNNNYEDSIEEIEFNKDYSISKYSKSKINKSDKCQSTQTRNYEYENQRVKKISETNEYNYANNKIEKIESYRKFEYSDKGLITKELFNNISYNNVEKVTANISYNEFDLISKIENQMAKYNMNYEYDSNGNWIKKTKETKNKSSKSIEEIMRKIEYK